MIFFYWLDQTKVREIYPENEFTWAKHDGRNIHGES